VAAVPVLHQQLKRLTRRRNQLVDEKVRYIGRLQSDLQAISPGKGVKYHIDCFYLCAYTSRMPRPLRIEYENAYYHVMNRGRGRQDIFHDERYFEMFLQILGEAHQRFGVEILCYCLMSNHYHLLLKTPESNLGRVMRHINGLYTQRYNRLKKTDGSLFRGRYKAVCVEEDSYQLQLSCYIHRNPLEAGLVTSLERYPWSSYPNYIGKVVSPKWLYRQEIYDQTGSKRKQSEKYKAFVELGVDDEIEQFYSKGNVAPYMGSDEFQQWIYEHNQVDESSVTKINLNFFRPSVSDIVEQVAVSFNVGVSSVITSRRGRVANNVPRWVALFLAQACAGVTLKSIANEFGLKRTGSIPTTIKKLRVLMDSDRRLMAKVMGIKRQYDT
jgi:putative transposase